MAAVRRRRGLLLVVTRLLLLVLLVVLLMATRSSRQLAQQATAAVLRLAVVLQCCRHTLHRTQVVRVGVAGVAVRGGAGAVHDDGAGVAGGARRARARAYSSAWMLMQVQVASTHADA